MRKLCCLLLCAILLAVVVIPVAAKAEDAGTGASAPFLLGDLNGDGQRTPLDYFMLKRHVLGTYRIPDAFLPAADINGNGKPDAMDYILLKRSILGTYKIADGEQPPSPETPSDALRLAVAFSLAFRTLNSDQLVALEGALGIELNALNELVISYLASLSIDGDELLRLENEITIQLDSPEQIRDFALSIARQIAGWLQSVGWSWSASVNP